MDDKKIIADIIREEMKNKMKELEDRFPDYEICFCWDESIWIDEEYYV